MQSGKFYTIFKSVAEFFSVLGNSDRIRILALLLEQERDVNQIHELLKISQPRASQSLKILKSYHILSENKVGKQVYYSIKDKKIAELIEKAFNIEVIKRSIDEESRPELLKELTELWHAQTKEKAEEE